ncbi:hypothetical protein L0Z10_30170 [Burkholderia multivorans]|nr:hypothetical protein [Burkholderia multivorans]MCO1459994.1 hypothetical protein [Burkholderia multivorans]
MFESNFPVDGLSCSYATLWNAFKRLAAGYSDEERHDLFLAPPCGRTGSAWTTDPRAVCVRGWDNSLTGKTPSGWRRSGSS